MPFSLWELLKSTEEQDYLRSLIKNKNWKPPSSDGSGTYVTYIEALEEIEKLMKEKPKGKQGVLGSGK